MNRDHPGRLARRVLMVLMGAMAAWVLPALWDPKVRQVRQARKANRARLRRARRGPTAQPVRQGRLGKLDLLDPLVRWDHLDRPPDRTAAPKAHPDPSVRKGRLAPLDPWDRRDR